MVVRTVAAERRFLPVKISAPKKSGVGLGETLDLSSCDELVDVSALGTLTALQELDLSVCRQLVDVSAWGMLTALRTLDLSRCRQVVDVSALRTLTALQELDLSGCWQLVVCRRWECSPLFRR